MNNNHTHTNKLIHSTSPYLQQHAHNPVNWYPWCEEAFERAEAENKLILVSIGYSACHWCHVMAHESFENEDIAKVMNTHYINIKVDREERPDVDQMYMLAIQLLSGNGGWPLNCFVLPNKVPVFGGTYFRPDQWKEILEMLANTYQRDPARVLEAAQSLRHAMIESEQSSISSNKISINEHYLNAVAQKFLQYFDTENGGYGRAPKFVLPNSLLYLLRYGTHAKNDKILTHVHFTLHRIQMGGIHDHLAGGFARYTVDAEWKIPHFEKMLYDNAQMLQLYAEAFQASKIELYRHTAYHIFSFLQNEMLGNEGLYYAALDADSEGVEGKFYVWNYEEIKGILGGKTEDFCKLYSVTEEGNWEETNILYTEMQINEFLSDDNINLSLDEINLARKTLLEARNKRVRPGTDTKLLLTWNSLLLEAFCHCYRIFSDDTFLNAATNLINSISNKMLLPQNELLHQYTGNNMAGKAFADGYASCINAMLTYAGISGEINWVEKAKNIADKAIELFYDDKQGFFFFTSKTEEVIVHRKTEIDDNVVPASNSMMLHALKALHLYTGKPFYRKITDRMLEQVAEKFQANPIYHSNWGLAMLMEVFAAPEIVICGENSISNFLELNTEYYPSAFWANSLSENELSIFNHRYNPQNTTIYVCRNNTCKLPVTEVKMAAKILIS